MKEQVMKAVLVLGLVACGGETAPAIGAVRFIAHVDGAEADRDPDGFEISGLPGTTGIAVSAGTAVTIEGLPADELEVTLAGVAENCSVANGPARAVTVVPDDTVQVSWIVTCGVRPATLTVSFAAPADASGGSLEVTLGDGAPVTLQPGGEIVFDHLAPGAYELEVVEPLDCRVQWPLVSTVHLVSGAEASIVLNGACPAGRIIFDVRGRLWHVNPDGTGLSEVTALADLVAATPALSPAGSEIAFTVDYRQLSVTDLNGSSLAVVTSMDESLEAPAWSPDGSQIAFLAVDPVTNTWDIFVVGRDGSDLRNITNSTHQENRPTWTRDGSRILYSAGRGDGVTMYTIRPDGTGRDSLAEGGNPVQSPTSDIIAFFDGGLIGVMDADGRNIRTVPGVFNSGGPLTWSPDGRLLVFYTGGAMGPRGIATVDLAGRWKVIVPDFGDMSFPTVSWAH